MKTRQVMQIIFVLRVFLGLWLLVSVLAKLASWRAFRAGIVDYQLGPPWAAGLAGWIVPGVELTSALMLLAGGWLRLAAGLTAFLVIVFGLAMAVNLRRGRRIPCYCHGSFRPRPIGAGAITRNLWLLACAMVLWRFAEVSTAPSVPLWVSPPPLAGSDYLPMALLVVWLWLMTSFFEVVPDVLLRPAGIVKSS